MRHHLLSLLMVIPAGLMPASPPLAAQEPPPADLSARVEALLRDLDADSYETRERASQAVAVLPGAALPLLEKALAEGKLSLEVRVRVEAALPKIRENAGREALGAGAAGRREARLAWMRRELPEAYDRAGAKDPRWDASAREALAKAAALWGGDLGVPEEDVLAACRRALDAGCGDPLVLYVRARMGDILFEVNYSETADRYAAAADPLQGSGYHPLWKARAQLRAAQALWEVEAKPSAETREAVRKRVEAGVALLASARLEPGVSLRDLFEPLERAARFEDLLGGTHEQAWGRVAERAAAAWPGTGMADYAAGHFDARHEHAHPGDHVEKLNCEHRHHVHEHRLDPAQEKLEAVLKKHPGDASPLPDLMVLAARREGSASAAEPWFQKAAALDPWDPEPYEVLLDLYLREEGRDRGGVLDFGRSCRDAAVAPEGNPALALLLVDAHEYFHVHAPFDENWKYYQDPKAWEDVRSVFEPLLAKHPGAVGHRTEYLRLACFGGHWETAHAQFEALGDRVRRVHFLASPSTFGDMKRTAARVAAKAAGKPEPPPPPGKPKYPLKVEIPGDTLNVRMAPEIFYPVIGTVPDGAMPEGYEKREGWYRILYEGREGWISGKHTTEVGGEKEKYLTGEEGVDYFIVESGEAVAGSDGLLKESIGLSRSDGSLDVLFAKGTQTPCSRTKTWVTGETNQRSFGFQFGRGDTRRFEEALFIGEYWVHDLPRRPKGSVHLRMTFFVEDGKLGIRGVIENTNRPAVFKKLH